MVVERGRTPFTFAILHVAVSLLQETITRDGQNQIFPILVTSRETGKFSKGERTYLTSVNRCVGGEGELGMAAMMPKLRFCHVRTFFALSLLPFPSKTQSTLAVVLPAAKACLVKKKPQCSIYVKQ